MTITIWPVPVPAPSPSAAELMAANINPRTGLATDYLNHFNEAIMLLELIPDMPDCYELFLEWQPLSYAEHFIKSNSRHAISPSHPMRLHARPSVQNSMRWWRT